MASVNDARNLDGVVKQEKERFKQAELSDADREAIGAFVAYREGRVSRNTYVQDLGNLRRMAEANGQDSLLELSTPSDVDRIISDLPRVENHETKNTYNRAIRQFLKWADAESRGDYGWVKDVEDYQGNNGGRRLTKEDYLTGEEVTALIEASSHPREEALIEFLADTGARINVVCNLRRGDVNLVGERPAFRPNPNVKDGYKGIEIKRYPIYYSERHLRRWLNLHHPDDDPDAPLFPVKIGYDKEDRENMACHPKTLEDQLKRLAGKAGLARERVHPHAFRHAAVRRMKTDPDFDFDWETVKLRTAWSDRAFEEMKHLYGELEEEEQLDYFFRRAGVETDDDGEPVEPHDRECPTCGELNRRGQRFCGQCARAMDPDMEDSRRTRDRGLGALSALVEDADLSEPEESEDFMNELADRVADELEARSA